MSNVSGFKFRFHHYPIQPPVSSFIKWEQQYLFGVIVMKINL